MKYLLLLALLVVDFFICLFGYLLIGISLEKKPKQGEAVLVDARKESPFLVEAISFCGAKPKHSHYPRHIL